jgi:hypothetical protein
MCLYKCVFVIVQMKILCHIFIHINMLEETTNILIYINKLNGSTQKYNKLLGKDVNHFLKYLMTPHNTIFELKMTLTTPQRCYQGVHQKLYHIIYYYPILLILSKQLTYECLISVQNIPLGDKLSASIFLIIIGL